MTWKRVPLKSLAMGETIFDGPHATPEKTKSGPIFFGIESLLDGRVNLELSAHLSEEQFAKWTRRVQPQENDLVFAYETSGPISRRVALVPAGLRCCLGRRMGLIRPNLSRIDPRFLLYAYLAPEFQAVLHSHLVQGSTVNRILLTELPE